MLPFVFFGLGTFALHIAQGGTDVLVPAHDRRATVVVVVLAECPIARAYSPELIRLSREYGPRGVRFAMAFADAEPPAIRAQMKAFGLPFEGAKADARLIRVLGATTAPTAAIIGAKGEIAYVGRIDDRFPSLGVQRDPHRRDLREALEAFLAGRKIVPSRTAVVGCALPKG